MEKAVSAHVSDALYRRVETLERQPRTLLVRDLPREACILLLGDPGTGKTTVLRAAAAIAEGGFVSVRAFLARASGRSASGGTLFLDALDEAMAARAAAPLDAVAGRLHEIGAPPFWLSCRPVDWAAIAGRSLLEDCAGSRGLLIVRLLPLEAEVIAEMVRGRGLDPRDFLGAVEEAGLTPLLGNPQTLGLLLDVAGRGEGLPRSRRELYEAATDLLAREANNERPRPALGQRVPTTAILQAAGVACAAMLLADRPFITIDPGNPEDDLPLPLDLLAPSVEDAHALQAALGTRLFAAVDERRWVAQHRTVAEFLAAGYIAERIRHARGSPGRGGLPLLRAIYLICGEGAPHPALRGLFAWLVTLLPERAEALVGRDPYGMFAYGDTSGLPGPAMTALLRGLEDLQESDPFFRAGRWGEARFADLASSALIPEVRRILAARPLRGHLLSCVLEGLAEGEPRPELVPDLVEFVTDAALSDRNRTEAIPALVRASSLDPGSAVKVFRRLLADRALDGRRRLLTHLFLRLYPVHLGLADLDAFTIAYLQVPGEDQGGGEIHLELRLPDLIRSGEEPAVLDTWAAQSWVPGERRPLSRGEAVGKVTRCLILRALPAIGPDDGGRLVEWLRVAAHDTDGGNDHRQVIDALAARPDLFVPLALAATEHGDPVHLRRAFAAVHNLREILPEDRWPADAGTRLLGAALAEPEPSRAELLFRIACWISFQPNSTALFEVVHAAAAREARFAAFLDPMCCTPIPPDELYWQRQQRLAARDRATRDARARAGKRKVLRAALPRMADGAAVEELAWLADVRFGRRWPTWARELNPAERIAALADPDLVQAAEAGWMRLASEADLPSAEEVGTQLAQGRLPLMANAWLAGADLLLATAEPRLPDLPPDRLARFLVLALVTTTFSENRDKPDDRFWIGRVAEAMPACSQAAVRDLLLTQFHTGQLHVEGLNTTLNDASFMSIRSELLPELLEIAPEGPSFDAVARAALRDLPGGSVLATVRRILATTGNSPAAARWRWLALGWRLSPEEFGSAIEAAVGENADLLSRLPEASGESFWGRQSSAAPELRLPHRALLVRLCGRHSPPAMRPGHMYRPLSGHQLNNFVQVQIERMSLDPDLEAGALLEVFRDDPALAQHRDLISHLLAVRRQDADRRAWETPSPERVVAALRGGLPASGTDLLSFVEDHLRTVDLELRRTGDNAWAGFWNTDSHGRAREAKVENRCRDHLSLLLRARFEAAGVMSGTEVRDAGDDRCDIVVFGGERTLPVEVKREWHPDLWTAWCDQLGDRYASSPTAGGLGIYLVFWFGQEPRSGAGRRPAPDGTPVTTPRDLEERLQDLVDASGYRLRVVVMDVSPVTRA